MADREQDKKQLSRRGLLKASALSSVAAFAAGCGAGASGPADADCTPVAAAADDSADLVLINGRIHTMNDANGVVSAVAVKNGKFAAVGDDAVSRNPRADVIDLGGRTVIPGVIEAHDHIVSLANRPGYHTPIESAASIAHETGALGTHGGARRDFTGQVDTRGRWDKP